jgi:hypothetical protein
MTLKYDDLLEFVNKLHQDGYETQVPEVVFYTKIQKMFGISSYIMKNISKSLHLVGLMRPLHNGFWEFINSGRDEKVQ